MTTKAATIMRLHAAGLSTREIALAVYGEALDKRMAYVRIVVRQRKGSGQSPADIRLRQSPNGRVAYNARQNEWQKRNRDKVNAWQRARYARKTLGTEERIS